MSSLHYGIIFLNKELTEESAKIVDDILTGGFFRICEPGDREIVLDDYAESDIKKVLQDLIDGLKKFGYILNGRIESFKEGKCTVGTISINAII